MNTPRVVGFPVSDTHGRSGRVTVSTDIIDYIDSARTFGREDLADIGAHGRFQRRMIALPDRRLAVVTSMVLTIGSENGLYLVRKDEGSSVGGWSLIDLGAQFAHLVGGTPRVHALGAAWTDDDRVAIAVAVDNSPTDVRSRVLVAYDVSSRDTDWERIGWVDCGVRENVRLSGIRVLDEGDGTWTVVLAGDRGPDDIIYLLKSNRPAPFNRALIFSPAVTLDEILDFEAAVHPIFGGGLAVLGTSRGGRILAFRPFPA
ncbi:MAG TPA: hypothetical protein VM450_11745, partial [Thermomicrobiales bacterium]|nr:hypothetical protein [Thermomicrobiales bacterium]